MQFATHYKRPEESYEDCGGPRLVELGSYVPAKKMIENMMNAGKRLELTRKDMFDLMPGQEPGNDAPLPRYNDLFDLIEKQRGRAALLRRCEKNPLWSLWRPLWKKLSRKWLKSLMI